MEKKDLSNTVKPQNEKSKGNNQWVSIGLDHYPDKRERRDGPGGEDSEEK